MAEDRMLSDEVLLALIKKNSGGGGGGTDDYNDLKNQPKINNNTLLGNKTASDLGLVAAETGKGLSTNDYTDADKAIVGGVTAALANKQDKTDNSLQTTDKTVVGAINEHEGDISSLMSGLTNYEATTNAALAVPENTGKNVLPITINQLKTLNTGGTWNDNVYAYKSLTYTVETDTRGYIASIKVNGTADSQAVFVLFNGNIGTGSYTLNGITGGSGSTYLFYAASAFGEVYSEKTANVSGSFEIDLYVRSKVTLSNQMFYPMIRPATITDATFAPYIPSVESRIEAVESGLTNLTNVLTISQNSDISKLIEGMNAVLITTGFVIGEAPVTPVTLSNNCRGYIMRNGSNLVGMISNYDSTIIYHISSTTINAISYYKDLS